MTERLTCPGIELMNELLLEERPRLDERPFDELPREEVLLRREPEAEFDRERPPDERRVEVLDELFDEFAIRLPG